MAGLRFGARGELSPRMRQLRQLSLFETLAPRELRIVDEQLHERRYQKGEIVFDEGGEGHALYIIVSGKVLICRQGDPVGARIGELGAGTFFGELALLDDLPRSAQARAEEDSEIAVFFRADFLNLLETHAVIASKIALQLARDLGRRLRGQVAAVEQRER